MNLTVSVDEDDVERARAVARQQGTSLNELVRTYIRALAGRTDGPMIAEALRRQWEVNAQSSAGSGGWKFNREEIYEERLDRYPERKP